MEVLMDVKAALESRFALVIDEHLEEMDSEHFVLTISGIGEDNNGEEGGNMDRLKIKFRIGKYEIEIGIKKVE